MKINFDLKCKIPSVEFCYNNKRVIIRYWGRLKFDKFVFYGGEEMSNNKQIEKPLELPHQETIVGTNTIQTKPFDNQKTMSNDEQLTEPMVISQTASTDTAHGIYVEHLKKGNNE